MSASCNMVDCKLVIVKLMSGMLMSCWRMIGNWMSRVLVTCNW